MYFCRLENDCKFIERLVKLEVARDEQRKTINQLEESDRAKSEEIAQLKDELGNLKAKETKSKVIVKVRLSKDVTLSVGQRLVYDTVVTNTGNAYSTHSGSFRAPVSGTYIFSVTACSKTSDWGVIDIINDGAVIGQVRSGDPGGYYDCSSDFTVAELDIGSHVWVQYNKGKSGIQNAAYWHSFTAVLVN